MPKHFQFRNIFSYSVPYPTFFFRTRFGIIIKNHSFILIFFFFVLDWSNSSPQMYPSSPRTLSMVVVELFRHKKMANFYVGTDRKLVSPSPHGAGQKILKKTT